MTEETNLETPAAEVPAPKPPADVDPQDPVVVSEDEEALKRATLERREKALGDEQSDAGTRETGGENDYTKNSTIGETGEAGGNGGVGEVQTSWPGIGVGNKVWLRGPGDPVAMTCALVTKVHENGDVNVTAFYDGEVPRPVANVPYGNADVGKIGWFHN